MLRSGRVGRRPVRNVDWMPRRVSCTVNVAVDTRRSAASASAPSRGRPAGAAAAAVAAVRDGVTPVANARASSVALGIAP